MRRFVPSAARVAVLGGMVCGAPLPRPAAACTPRPEGIHQVLPEDPGETELPANGTLFIEYEGPVPEAGLVRRAPADDNQLAVSPFGAGWVIARLPAEVLLRDGVERASVLVAQSGTGAERSAGPLRIALVEDTTPPTPVDGVEWTLDQYEEPPPCGRAGYHLRGQFLPGSVDPPSAEPVAGYALVEFGAGDGRDRRDVLQFMPPSPLDGPVGFVQWLAEDAAGLQGRCFAIASVDRAGTLSSLGNDRICWNLITPDAGVPDASTGAQDASSLDVAPSDTGPVDRDAGSGGSNRLAPASEEGCRCTSPLRTARPAWILVPLAVVLRRRNGRLGRPHAVV